MRRLQILLILTSALVIGSSLALAGQPVVTNFEVIEELILDAHASEEVDLSPEDVGRLKQILDGPTVREMLKVAHRKVRQTHSVLDPDIARRLAQASVNEEFYKLFQETISDAQFTFAKQRLIQKRYPLPTAVFRDMALLQWIGVDKLPAKLQAKLDAAEGQAAKEIMEVRRQRVIRVLKHLPQPTHQLLVNCVGNEHLPMLTPQETDPEKIPFSAYARSSGAVTALLLSPELAKHVELTDEQRDKHSAARSKQSSVYAGAASGKNSLAEVKESVEAASRQTQREMQAVLNAQQRLKLYRWLSKQELENDPVSYVANAKVSSYLGLDRDAVVAFAEAATVHTQEFTRATDAINQRLFTQLCAELEPRDKQAMNASFGEVWGPKRN
ncbi:MAG: hypothetical protein IT423_16715 [Pirellulaceae bacterium]|nr:hypothetical protein [Pirellulaceae bacterium]